MRLYLQAFLAALMVALLSAPARSEEHSRSEEHYRWGHRKNVREAKARLQIKLGAVHLARMAELPAQHGDVNNRLMREALDSVGATVDQGKILLERGKRRKTPVHLDKDVAANFMLFAMEHSARPERAFAALAQTTTGRLWIGDRKVLRALGIAEVRGQDVASIVAKEVAGLKGSLDLITKLGTYGDVTSEDAPVLQRLGSNFLAPPEEGGTLDGRDIRPFILAGALLGEARLKKDPDRTFETRTASKVETLWKAHNSYEFAGSAGPDNEQKRKNAFRIGASALRAAGLRVPNGITLKQVVDRIADVVSALLRMQEE